MAVKEYHPLRSSTGVGRGPCTSIDTQLAEVQAVTVRDTTLLSHQMDDLTPTIITPTNNDVADNEDNEDSSWSNTSASSSESEFDRTGRVTRHGASPSKRKRRRRTKRRQNNNNPNALPVVVEADVPAIVHEAEDNPDVDDCLVDQKRGKMRTTR